MIGMEENTDDRKRQEQHKSHAQIWTRQTKVSVQDQPYRQAFNNASLKSAFSMISRGLVVYISLGKVDLFLKDHIVQRYKDQQQLREKH